MRSKPPLRVWIWPPPPVARRLWGVILVATAYSLVVYLFAADLIARLPGWSSEFGLVNGIVLGVLVGIRTRSAFDRWFEGQKLWGEVLIHARNLALKVAHLVRADPADRRLFAVLLGAFADALAAQLRGIDARLEASPEVEPLPPDAKHIPAHLAGRMYALTARWHRDGRVDLPGLWALEANVRAMMDAAGNCERVAQTPVPMSFHALLRHGLLLSLVLAPWHLIHALGLWALPVQALIIYFLFGIELTAEEIENPFGTDVDDLPLAGYCATVRRDVADILAAADEKTRPPVPPAPPHAVGGTIPTLTRDHAG
jgi:putative membrane protein